eukprot:jgi/Bigna1/88336/estExt_fgenesh1_pg.C_300185
MDEGVRAAIMSKSNPTSEPSSEGGTVVSAYTDVVTTGKPHRGRKSKNGRRKSKEPPGLLMEILALIFPKKEKDHNKMKHKAGPMHLIEKAPPPPTSTEPYEHKHDGGNSLQILSNIEVIEEEDFINVQKTKYERRKMHTQSVSICGNGGWNSTVSQRRERSNIHKDYAADASSFVVKPGMPQRNTTQFKKSKSGILADEMQKSRRGRSESVDFLWIQNKDRNVRSLCGYIMCAKHSNKVHMISVQQAWWKMEQREIDALRRHSHGDNPSSSSRTDSSNNSRGKNNHHPAAMRDHHYLSSSSSNSGFSTVGATSTSTTTTPTRSPRKGRGSRRMGGSSPMLVRKSVILSQRAASSAIEAAGEKRRIPGVPGVPGTSMLIDNNNNNNNRKSSNLDSIVTAGRRLLGTTASERNDNSDTQHSEEKKSGHSEQQTSGWSSFWRTQSSESIISSLTPTTGKIISKNAKMEASASRWRDLKQVDRMYKNKLLRKNLRRRMRRRNNTTTHSKIDNNKNNSHEIRTGSGWISRNTRTVKGGGGGGVVENTSTTTAASSAAKSNTQNVRGENATIMNHICNSVEEDDEEEAEEASSSSQYEKYSKNERIKRLRFWKDIVIPEWHNIATTPLLRRMWDKYGVPPSVRKYVWPLALGCAAGSLDPYNDTPADAAAAAAALEDGGREEEEGTNMDCASNLSFQECLRKDQKMQQQLLTEYWLLHFSVVGVIVFIAKQSNPTKL